MKKIRLLCVSILLFALYSCTADKQTKTSANVESVQGLPVFINAEPAMKYSALGEPISLDAINDVGNSGSGKNGVDALINEFATAAKDLDFAQKLEKMVSKARQQYPDAEGIIFRDRMNSCQAIKFQ